MSANAIVKYVLNDFTPLMCGVEVLFMNQWMKGALDPMPEPRKSLSIASLQIPGPVAAGSGSWYITTGCHKGYQRLATMRN